MLRGSANQLKAAQATKRKTRRKLSSSHPSETVGVEPVITILTEVPSQLGFHVDTMDQDQTGIVLSPLPSSEDDEPIEIELDAQAATKEDLQKSLENVVERYKRLKKRHQLTRVELMQEREKNELLQRQHDRLLFQFRLVNGS